MASSPTTRLRLEKQGTGDNLNTWGDRLNTVLDLVDEAIAGFVAIAVSATAIVLASTNYASDDARNAVVELTGTLSANSTVTVPSVEKPYLVVDSTTRGGYTLTLKTAAGSGYALRPGPQWVYSDGSDVYRGTPRLDQVPLPTAALDLNSQRITSLGTPSASADAVTKAYADALFAAGSANATAAAGSASDAAVQAAGAASERAIASAYATLAGNQASAATVQAAGAGSERALASAYATLAAAAVNGVKVTSADTSPGWLDNKVTVAGPLVKTVGGAGASETLALGFSISGQSALTSGQVDRLADYLLVYDASATAHRKVLVNDLGAGLVSNTVTATTQAIAVNSSYINNPTSAQATYSLPTTAAVGDRFEIIGKSDSYGWRITQASGQSIQYGNQVTTTGTTGGLLAADVRAAVEIVCITADTTFQVVDREGTVSSLDPTGYVEGGIGASSPIATIEAFAFDTQTVSAVVAAMSVPRQEAVGGNSATKGYAFGGYNGSITIGTLEALTFGATPTVALLASTMGTATRGLGGAGANSTVKLYAFGGSSTSSYTNVIATISAMPFANETIGVLSATLDTAKHLSCGLSGASKSWTATGTLVGSATTYTAVIEDMTYSTDVSVAIVATLDTAKNGGAGINAPTKSYVLGGITATAVIEDLVHSGETSAAIAATLSTTHAYGGGVNSGTLGFELGAYNGSTYVAVINRLTYSGETCTSIGATLATARYAGQSFQTGGWL